MLEKAGVDSSSNIWRILSQFEPSEKVQSQQLPGAPPPLDPWPGPAIGLTAPPRLPAVWAMTFSLRVCLRHEASAFPGEKNYSGNSPCLPLHSKCPISATAFFFFVIYIVSCISFLFIDSPNSSQVWWRPNKKKWRFGNCSGSGSIFSSQRYFRRILFSLRCWKRYKGRWLKCLSIFFLFFPREQLSKILMVDNISRWLALFWTFQNVIRINLMFLYKFFFLLKWTR